ncbi:MAG: Smr/MutS family protein [Acetobacteraceae bacterium]|nr:Smr/MutS family protein [Acetobacteraceae bacterium]
MAVHRRPLTEAERGDWAAFARDVAALPHRALPEPPAGNAATPPPRRERPPPRPVASTPLAVGEAPGGLDARSWNRLRGGKIAPERTLDLHGRTVQRAYHALRAFLHAAHTDRVRCVQIITGKGSGEAGGAIRRELPAWLNAPDLRPLILAARHAHPANPGAVLLLLRRVRVSGRTG